MDASCWVISGQEGGVGEGGQASVERQQVPMDDRLDYMQRDLFLTMATHLDCN